VNALLVCASPSPGAEALVRELCAAADVIVAVDGGGSVCRGAGVVPDVVLGDFDSLPEPELRLIEASGARVVRFRAEKDATDLELAFAEARSLGATRVTLTAASGGRLDHVLGVVAAMAANGDLWPQVAEPTSRAWMLSEAGRRRLVLAGRGSIVSLLPVGGSATVTATGLRWPLVGAILDPAQTLGLSNRIVGGSPAEVEVLSGTLLVLSPRVDDLPPAAQPSEPGIQTRV